MRSDGKLGKASLGCCETMISDDEACYTICKTIVSQPNPPWNVPISGHGRAQAVDRGRSVGFPVPAIIDRTAQALSIVGVHDND